jgi:hypothetical protein
MRKSQLHVWITMMVCVVAVAAQAVQAGVIHLPF